MSIINPQRGPAHSAYTLDAPIPIDESVDFTDLDTSKVHWELGIALYDSNGDALASDGSLSFAIAIYRASTPFYAEAPPSGAISAATPAAAGWDANTKRVTITPSGAGVNATHYLPRLDGNA